MRAVLKRCGDKASGEGAEAGLEGVRTMSKDNR